MSKSFSVFLKTLACMLLHVASANAQSVDINSEYSKKVRAASVVGSLNEGSFGQSVSDSNGSTVFTNIDIDIPGNSRLPVSFGRRLVIGERFIAEELGGLGNWDIDVPFIEGTFDATYGWTVGGPTFSGRYNRCSNPAAPEISGTRFTAAEVWHGYNIHVPGALDGQLSINKGDVPVPEGSEPAPWVVGLAARLSCLPSLKNGGHGEGFLLRLPNGTKYYFDYPVERFAPSLYKGPRTVSGYGIQRKRIFLLATRIEDPFGNSVDYNYNAGRLESIVGSDGRRIDIAYPAGGVTATANGRTWSYGIVNGHLRSVTLPDGGRWEYSEFGSYSQRPASPPSLPFDTFDPTWMCNEFNEFFAYSHHGITVKHPSGANADFEFSAKSFPRQWVPYSCAIDFFDHQRHVVGIPSSSVVSNNFNLSVYVAALAAGYSYAEAVSMASSINVVSELPSGSFVENVSGYARNLIPQYFGVLSISRLTVSGPGVPDQVTRYEYDGNTLPQTCDARDFRTGAWGIRCSENPCLDGVCTLDESSRKSVVHYPSGVKVNRYVGNVYGVNEGFVLREETIDVSGNIVSEVDYRHLNAVEASSQVFPAVLKGSLASDVMGGLIRPLISTQITQGGVTYRNDVQFCSGTAYCFTPFAQPTMVRKWNSLGMSRTDVTEYENNLAVWVLGQTKRAYNVDTGGVVESEVGYNAQAMPIWVKSYGKLRQAISYNADGTVATVADGNNNVLTLSNWKRGIPQLIRHPVTPEAPQGGTESAIVNDNGWITSVTDETGAVTGYGYDAMGRLASIVEPTGDAIAAPSNSGNYYNTLRNFRVLTASDWKPAGVVDGQWRLYEEAGTRVNITYMDALWRPILKHEFDAQNTAATLRASKMRYDISGRVSFQSYPSSDVVPGDTGMRTFYDALNRVTRVEQDSEHGVLATTTHYLSGLKTLVTNPKGFSTTTSFMAWDQPTYDFPILSEQPEGKVIQIGRHPQFGWPLSLTQRNSTNTLSATRRYVYDDNAQLCKTIEPETGATVMGYDGAGNPTWQAAGLDAGAYGSLTDCQYVAASNSGRVVTRQYDARNRLTHLTFPNGLGNQIWTYEKDNLPKSVTAYNNAGNATPVITTYAYNKRRLLVGETLAQPGWYSWSVGYAYDGYGHLSTQTYPTGLVVDYAPNPLGQPTKAGTFATGAQYYPNGALKQFSYGNGIVHTMSQNARQLPARSTSSGGALDLGYFYDNNGNVTHIADHGRGSNFHRWMEYDNLDRLTGTGSVAFGGDHWHRMTYDALDNLKSWKLAGVKDYAEYVYDAQNHRLTSIRNTAGATVVGLGYDPQGNLANKNGQGYSFDFGNRLRDVPGKENYRYDGLGRRVLAWQYPTPAKPSGTVTLSQYTQSGQVIYQEDHDRSTAMEHIYLAGSIIATREPNWATGQVALKYQHTDALGSPVAVTNASGQVIERMDYEPWGAIIGKPNHNGIGYTGHVMDGATGLTYMQQRYYDQSVGRFLSVDPIAARQKGDNFNRYAYAFNNPYRFIDPDGRDGMETIGQHMAWAEPGYSESMQKASQGFLSSLLKGASKALDIVDQTMTALGPQAGGASKLAVLPLARIAKGGAKSLSGASKALTVEARAAKLAAEAGSNSVSVRTSSGLIRYDLQGKAHHSKVTNTAIPTPHVQQYQNRLIPSGPRAGEVGSVTRAGDATPATHADLRVVERILEKRKSP